MMKNIIKYHKKIILGCQAIVGAYLFTPTSFSQQFFDIDTHYIATGILIISMGLFYKFYFSKSKLVTKKQTNNQHTPGQPIKPKITNNLSTPNNDPFKIIYPTTPPPLVEPSRPAEPQPFPEGKKDLFKGMV